jgi:hypothetical protein
MTKDQLELLQRTNLPLWGHVEEAANTKRRSAGEGAAIDELDVAVEILPGGWRRSKEWNAAKTLARFYLDALVARGVMRRDAQGWFRFVGEGAA